MTKKEIRKIMLQKRNDTHQDLLNKQTLTIINQIEKDPHFIQAKTVAIFYPMPREVDLLPLLKHHEKTFCFPKVEGDFIRFYPFHQDTVFKKSSFGVLEPDGQHDYCENIDYMLAPALAISHDLYRVGYGKGFYDRFLKMHRPKKVIGVIYDFQIIDECPHDTSDEKLDGYYKGYL